MKTNRFRRRWGDNDRYYGPFTYARDGEYRHTGIELRSAGEDDDDGASLRVSGFGHTVIVGLPGWVLRPAREWVDLTHREWATSPGYWQVMERRVGFSLYDGHLSIHYGRQAMDSSIDRQWGYSLPWTQWRHVRHSFYNLDGSHLGDEPQTARHMTMDERHACYEAGRALQECADKARFNFLDYDDEHIVATCHIEEREWRRGTGWCRWMSLFWPARINRSLILNFSSEVGKRKGSWKGGTLGHSIRMKPGETAQDAFMRYCLQEGLTYAGWADNYLLERYGITEKPWDWNKEVLRHFHNGPELRGPSEAFSGAFHQRAAEKISSGLKDAVAFAQGDTSKGTAHVVDVQRGYVSRETAIKLMKDEPIDPGPDAA